MEPSAEQALITSLHQHRLGLTSLISSPSVRRVSGTRGGMAMPSEHGEHMDIAAGAAAELGWLLAMQAQSCAYLALELQKFAEELSASRITCPELTYRRLYVSIETFTRLLENMRQSYVASNQHEIDNSIPVLSEHLVGAIRSMLAQDQATITGGSMTNTERASRKNTSDAGDTK